MVPAEHSVLVMSQKSILRDVRKLIEPHLQKFDHRYSLSGRKVPLLRIHMRYNILVMKMNGEDRGTIQDWVNENYSHIPESIQRGHPRGSEQENANEKPGTLGRNRVIGCKTETEI